MIIAANDHVRMKGDTANILAEFTTIASALMDEAEISSDLLKLAIDLAKIGIEKDPKSPLDNAI